jgi:outer membrane lipoprotein SlyB
MTMNHPKVAARACAVLALWGCAAACAAPAAAAAAAAASAPTARQLAALCDDCAIVERVKTEKRKGKATALGTAGGAVVGGVVGHEAGDGGLLATGAGAVVGAVVGREVEKHVKRQKVWVTTVTLRDGTTRKFDTDGAPGFKPGDTVRVEGDKLVAMPGAKK